MKGLPSPRGPAWSASLLVALVAALVAATGAQGYLTSTGEGTGVAGVGTLAAPATMSAQLSGADVALAWGAATLSSGAPVDGYVVTRSPGGVTVCGASTLVVGRACTDTTAPSGTHTYTVKAVYRSFSASRTSSPLDVVSAPTITTKPSDPSASTAPNIAFSGGTSYKCRLDGAALAPCTSPRQLAGLTAGEHTFRVLKVEGGVDGPERSYTWTMDNSAPTISAKPSDPSPTAAPQFSFTHVRSAYTLYACQLDGAATTCSSPKSYSGLADGSHTFQVKARAGDGSQTQTATYTWTVDATAPTQAVTNARQSAKGLVWANQGGNTIARANIDGTGVNQSLVTGAVNPLGVAVSGSNLFWTNARSSGTAGTIGRAGLDGSNATVDFAPAQFVWGAAANASHVFWTDTGHNWIGRMGADGSSANASFITGASGPTSVAVTDTHIYWGNTGTKKIGRANLDGSGVDQSFITLPTAAAYGVAVSAAHVYWGSLATGSIGRANLDGSGVDQSFIPASGGAQTVAVDDEHVYWGTGGNVGRAKLDGSAKTTSFITGGNGVNALAVVPGQATALLRSGTVIFKGDEAGSLKLTTAVTDAGSGPGGATFPDVATPGWTHAAETVTTGSGTATSKSYESSAFSWTAGASAPTGFAVTGRDVAGGTSGATPVAFASDTTAPAGAALVVAGTPATTAGATVTRLDPGFAIESRTDPTEAPTAAQAGLRSATLTVQSATSDLTGSTCGAPGSAGPYASPVTITGTTHPAGRLAARCYTYVLRGEDLVGNVQSISTTVRVAGAGGP